MISFAPHRWYPALVALLLAAALAFAVSPSQAAEPAPTGRAVMAWHVTIAPSWFDPSTAPPQITPFGMLYAIHDALVRPYPGQKMGPSLAQSWEESEDGLTYQFTLRPGPKFHNSDPVTTEDVKFSFERYQGAGAQTLKDHVSEVEVIDPLVVRFHLRQPWADFMTFYGTTATAAGIVVPKKYLIEVGDDGFKKHPVGAGPYKFVSTKPGVEVVLEADPGYWRRVPAVTPGHAEHPRRHDASAELEDRRGRHCLRPRRRRRRGHPERPRHPDRRDQARIEPVDRVHRAVGPEIAMAQPAAAARGQLCARPPANHRGGLPRLLPAGGGAIRGFPTIAESVMNYLNAAGIRVRLKQMERAAFYADWQTKKLRGLFMTGAGNSGNAASRVETFIQSKGAYAYGGYPDIDELVAQQAGERDHAKREALLYKIQQLTIDRVMYAPVMDLRALMGVGPRVTKHTITDVWMSPFPSYEDIEIKG